jgi:hypothetical protein
LPLSGPMERYFPLLDITRAHGDLGSTHILTRHHGAKSQTISQLTNLRIASTRQVPAFWPLRVIETPTDGVGAHAAPPSNNLDGTVGLH